jgi:alpha-L-fucosidase
VIREDIEENKESSNEIYVDLPENIQKKLEWFKDQKLGVIFHWGLYSVAGIVESWQLSEEDSWARKNPWRNSIEELRRDYWGLNHHFNPYAFNPKEWAEKCKKAGMKYMLFTTKHHDGFNMYDTNFSEYKVTGKDCPYHLESKSDVFKEVSSAFREMGISVGAYYSKPDWHNGNYWRPEDRPIGRYSSYSPKDNIEQWNKYNEFVKNQLVELSEDYGDLDILWLDGGWVNKGEELLDMDNIISSVRKNQPDILVVDRTIGGKYENYVTPERKIPEIPPKKAWESNIPIANNWGFCPNDHYKSFEEILITFVRIVSLGGNLILGVGPKPNGELPEDSLKVMEDLGEWLEVYGEGIYATRPWNVKLPQGWYGTKNKDNYYLFFEDKAQSLEINSLFDSESEVIIINLLTREQITKEEDILMTNSSYPIGCYKFTIKS